MLGINIYSMLIDIKQQLGLATKPEETESDSECASGLDSGGVAVALHCSEPVLHEGCRDASRPGPARDPPLHKARHHTAPPGLQLEDDDLSYSEPVLHGRDIAPVLPPGLARDPLHELRRDAAPPEYDPGDIVDFTYSEPVMHKIRRDAG